MAQNSDGWPVTGDRNPQIQVEVVYALREKQLLIVLNVEEGTTVRQAIERSGIVQRMPGIGLASVGLFGRAVPLDTLLKDGDRVEIYRPLIADPKQARRDRAGRRR
ncbi:MAG: RnfH family protein [Betaproteobacteria bacterium]|nr:RnfH family protein [Betaproteobacteria bacterium]